MSGIQETTPWGRRILLGWCVCGVAICDFLTPPIMEALGSAGPTGTFVPLMGILMGFIAAQCGLMAIWGAIGPLRTPTRLIVTLTVSVFLMVSFGAGLMVSDAPSSALRDMASCFWFLPLFFLAIQSPLWGLKLVTGGRITCTGPHSRQSTASRPQFGLRDVMIGTVVIAAVLSLASSGMQVSEAWGTEDWSPLLIFCLSSAAVSTFSTLPCLWAGMIARNKLAAAGIVVVYTLLMSLVCLAVIDLLTPGRPMPLEIREMFFVFCGTLMAVILGALHVARLCGYRFISWRRPKPALPADCPFAHEDDSFGGAQAAETPAADAGEPIEPDRPSR